MFCPGVALLRICRRSLLPSLFCLSVFSIGSKATTPEYLDSVENNLKTTKVLLEKLNSLYTLSFEYGFIEPRKGIAYGYQCLDLATRHRDLSYQLNAYNGIANGYEALGLFDSARYFHSRSYEIAVQMKAPPKMALTLFNVALCYKQLGDYRKALSIYLEAYRILEKQDTYNPRIHFYLGEMYLKTGDIKKAEEQSRLGIAKCLEFNHPYILYNMQVNLARCQNLTGRSDSALVLLTSALKGLKEHTDQTSVALCLSALGQTYALRGDHGQAAVIYQQENELQKQLKNPSGEYLSGLGVASSLAERSGADKALVRQWIGRSMQLLPAIRRNADAVAEGYGLAALAYRRIGDWKEALEAFRQQDLMEDSTLNSEKFMQINELQVKYETEKKQNEIVSLRQEQLLKSFEILDKDQAIRLRNVWLLVVLMAVILGGALIYFFIQRRMISARLEKEIAVRNTEEAERQRLAKDIHDDLGSGLSKISFLSEIIMKETGLKTEAAQSARGISETSRKLVVNMRDLIWALNPANTTVEGLFTRIREYTSDYLEDFPADLEMNLPERADPRAITKESHRHILMTVKESLNNIVKHSGASKIAIHAKTDPEKLILEITDYGIGFDAGAGKGNGLANMSGRIRSIGGWLDVVSTPGKGTTICVSITWKAILREGIPL